MNEEKRERKQLTKKNKLIIIIVAAVLGVFILSGGIYCIVTQQSPITAIQNIADKDNTNICAKWQSQDKPELSAYVFYENGTYDSYFSNFNFDGQYTINRNKIKLINPDTKKELVYKFTIRGDVLSLILIEEDGKVLDEPELSKFDRVDELNMKSLTDIIGDIKKDKEEK